MKFKKKKDQSVDASILLRKGNKIITGGKRREGTESGEGRGKKEAESGMGRDRREYRGSGN